MSRDLRLLRAEGGGAAQMMRSAAVRGCANPVIATRSLICLRHRTNLQGPCFKTLLIVCYSKQPDKLAMGLAKMHVCGGSGFSGSVQKSLQFMATNSIITYMVC
jgi:hypothetical protein